jgi:antitoxin component YwqK of YwqJK toxin-antitoxin module
MSKTKNITPENNKGEGHGYWEWYCDGNLWFKCFYQNDKLMGYEEIYDTTGNSKLDIKRYYL